MAEALKDEGNARFRARDYRAAEAKYSAAIAADPNGAVLFSNRAAARLELGDTAGAAADAQRSIALAPSHKAFARLGRARWGQQQLPEALAAYRQAVSMQPERSYDDAVAQLERALGPAAPASGADAQLVRFALLDASVVAAAAVHLVAAFVSGWLAAATWRVALLAMAARQLLGLAAQCGVPAGPTPAFGRALLATAKANAEGFAVQWLWLPLAWAVLGAPPVHLLLVSMALYAFIDGFCPLRPPVRRQFEAAPAAAAILARAAPYLRKAEHPASRQALLTNAAICEIIGVVVAPLAGVSLLGAFLGFHFLRRRYAADPAVRQAGAHLTGQMHRLAHHPRAPAPVGRAFDAVCRLVGRLAP